MKFEIYLYTPEKMQGFYKKAIGEYEKRLSRYGKIALHMIRKEKEWLKILEETQKGFYLTAGSSLSSEKFSERIAEWEGERRKDITFFIDQEDRKEDIADHLTAFSISDFHINGAMTVMILYEQIYRAYRIMHNHPYHK